MKNVRACEGNTNTIQADYISLEILHQPFTRWVCQRFCIVNSFGGTRWFDRTCGYTAWCLEQRRRWLLALRFCTLGMRFSEDLPPASFRRGLSYQIASIFWGDTASQERSSGRQTLCVFKCVCGCMSSHRVFAYSRHFGITIFLWSHQHGLPRSSMAKGQRASWVVELLRPIKKSTFKAIHSRFVAILAFSHASQWYKRHFSSVFVGNLDEER